jgi:uncharacterized cupin superfamily protein
MNLRDLKLNRIDDGPEGHHFSARRLTDDVGSKLTGMGVYELEPGQASWPYHFELADEEWLIVIEGELTLRTPDGERVLVAGDVACFPAGAAGAHAVRNHSNATVRYLMPSAAPKYGTGCIYPDSGQFVLYGPGFKHRGYLGDEVDYWEGET